MAAILLDDLAHHRLPDNSALLARFVPDPAPDVCVRLAPLSSNEVPLESTVQVQA